MNSRIPIQNLYFLLCYVWDMMPEKNLSLKDREECPRIENFYGSILSVELNRMINKGLKKGYKEEKKEIYGIRGKLKLSASIKSGKLFLGYTECVAKQYTLDIIENRFLKKAICSLLDSEDLNDSIRLDLESLRLRLCEVDENQVSIKDYRKIQLYGNTSQYAILLEIAQLIFDMCIVNEKTGKIIFYDVRDDDLRMSELFEKFIFNYSEAKLLDVKVTRPHISWTNVVANEQSLQHLPGMRTDMVLSKKERHPVSMIVDMKYWTKPHATIYNIEKLRSEHLYQIYTYLSNAKNGDCDRTWKGMLLYAVVDQDFGYDYELNELPVHICAINLNQYWMDLEKDLDNILLFALNKGQST